MEDRTDSPMAVKVERHSRCIILTYFHGDINSMVDAHFTRALSNVCKDRAPAAKTKKIRKTIKLGKHRCILTTIRTIIPIHPPYTVSAFVPHREDQSLSGECCGHLLQVTGYSCRAHPDLKPCGRHSWVVALVYYQGRRGPRATVHRILPVPRRVESYWTAIRDIPAQPTAEWPGWDGTQHGPQLQARSASRLDGAARI